MDIEKGNLSGRKDNIVPTLQEQQNFLLLWEKLNLFFLHMRIWIIQVIFLPFMQRDSEDLYMRQMQPAICVILCSETVHISRCLRQSGETVKADDRGNRNLYRHILWKMRWA